MQVDLTPIGAFSLLGVPMCELANQVVPIDDVLERWVEDVSGRLLEARTWRRRLQIVDQAVNAAIASGPPASAEVRWAWQELNRRAGRGAVGDLAQAVGWSQRHLNARFREQIGATPKSVARLLRFHRAVQLLTDPARSAPLANLATEHGYYDQAHLNREFREFAGCAPNEFLHEETSFA